MQPLQMVSTIELPFVTPLANTGKFLRARVTVGKEDTETRTLKTAQWSKSEATRILSTQAQNAFLNLCLENKVQDARGSGVSWGLTNICKQSVLMLEESAR